MNHAHSYLDKTKIAKELGYFPAFLLPAINSSLVFRSLIQQTLFAYVENPLPSLFKEKLFVCLSRYFGASYFTICHSCTLLSLGVSAAEILALAKITASLTKENIATDLNLLYRKWNKYQKQDSQLEASLLRCSCFVFIYTELAANCTDTLKKTLGTVYYNYLMILLGYIKLCHSWLANNPKISHHKDRRSQLYFSSLLLLDNRLANFLQSNVDIESKQNRITAKASETKHLLSSKDNLNLLSRFPDKKLKQKTLIRQIKLKTVTDCLANFPLPVMIHSRDEKILYLNRHWVEITGYNIADISNLKEWRQKAKVKQHGGEKSYLTSQLNNNHLPCANAIATPTRFDRISLDKNLFATNSNGIAHPNQLQVSHSPLAEVPNTLEEVAASLSNLAEEIERIELEIARDRTIKDRVSIITNDGKQRFWQTYTIPFALESPEKLTISIAKDITEVLNTQTRLTEMSERLELLQEVTNSGSWSWDLANNKIEICNRGLNILGLDDFDGSYQSFLQSIPPEARGAVDLSLTKAIDDRRDVDLKYPVIRKQYAIFWIRLKCKFGYNSAKEIIKLSGIVMDVTSQKSIPLATSDVRLTTPPNTSKSFEELTKIVDILPSYIFVSDVDCKTISWINLKLANSLGLPTADVAKGKKITEYFSPQYARQIVWHQQRVLTYDKEINLQQEVKLVDGIHYFDTTIAPLRDDRGEIYALLHTSNEIPDLAATKEALSQQTLQLEAANKELESFSYSVSHDLQAPLRIINGFSQVIWENYQPNLDDRGKHYLQRIKANSEKMSDLIDALLKLSRVTRSQMKSVEVNLTKIAWGIAEELQQQDPARQVEFTIADNLIAKGDPQLLTIVLDNLLNNAWKYTSKRSQAKIEFEAMADGDDKLIFYVRDNGAGFDLEYADKLFTAFKRLHSLDEFPGTGIGLATVKRIIYRHGGRVWANGESDRGATIYFSL